MRINTAGNENRIHVLAQILTPSKTIIKTPCYEQRRLCLWCICIWCSYLQAQSTQWHAHSHLVVFLNTIVQGSIHHYGTNMHELLVVVPAYPSPSNGSNQDISCHVWFRDWRAPTNRGASLLPYLGVSCCRIVSKASNCGKTWRNVKVLFCSVLYCCGYCRFSSNQQEVEKRIVHGEWVVCRRNRIEVRVMLAS